LTFDLEEDQIPEEDQVLEGDPTLDIDTILEEDLDHLDLMVVDMIKQRFFDVAKNPQLSSPNICDRVE